jgi:hypothetical protein
MSKVFVPQIPTYRKGGVFVPKYDLSKAEKWGTVVPLIKSGNVRASEVASAHRSIIAKMDEEFTDEDFLLLMGDPVAQAMMVSSATQLTDVIKILKWDRHGSLYYVQSFDVTY